MADIQSAMAGIRRGEKEEDGRNHRAKIKKYNVCIDLLCRVAIIIPKS